MPWASRVAAIDGLHPIALAIAGAKDQRGYTDFALAKARAAAMAAMAADAVTAGGATQQLIDAMASYDQALPAAALPIINAAVAGTISVGSHSLAVPAALYSRRAFG